MDEIEKTKSSLVLPPSGQEYVLERAFKAFMFADKSDRSGNHTKSTASAFRAAALTFEALKQFGEIPEEIATRMKYSVWRASHIMTKLAAGEAPDPPPASSAEEAEIDRLAQQEPEVGAAPVQGLQFFEKLNQDIAYTKEQQKVLTFPQPPSAAVPPQQQQVAAASNPYGAGPAMSFPAPPGDPVFPTIPQQMPTAHPAPAAALNPYAALPNPPAAAANHSSVPATLFPDVPSSNLLHFPAPPTMSAHLPAASGPANNNNNTFDFFDLPSVPQSKAGETKVSHPAPGGAPPPSGHGNTRPPPAKQTDVKMVSKPAPPIVRPDNDDDEEDVVNRPAAPKIFVTSQPACYIPTSGDISAAQRLSKTAFSALNFDDTATAVRDLCEALHRLTGATLQISK